MSVLLLFCSVLVVKSLQRSLDAPIGFEPRGLVTVSFDLDMQNYDEQRGRDFQKRVLDKVRQLPGVESAALVARLPLTLNVPGSRVISKASPCRSAPPTYRPLTHFASPLTISAPCERACFPAAPSTPGTSRVANAWLL